MKDSEIDQSKKYAVSALTSLVGRQERHPERWMETEKGCKNTLYSRRLLMIMMMMMMVVVAACWLWLELSISDISVIVKMEKLWLLLMETKTMLILGMLIPGYLDIRVPCGLPGSRKTSKLPSYRDRLHQNTDCLCGHIQTELLFILVLYVYMYKVCYIFQ